MELEYLHTHWTSLDTRYHSYVLSTVVRTRAPQTATGPASNTGVAFFNSVTMTIATELGDKTFCIAALMAMRYNRIFVFAGAIGALLVMTVLAVGIGVAVPTLLPKTYTHYAAAALFAYFGTRLLREAQQMKVRRGEATPGWQSCGQH